MKKRLALGHSYTLESLPNWDMGALTPSGGLKSTANDLLTLLGVALGYRDGPLARAMATTVSFRRPTGDPDRQSALGWQVIQLEPMSKSLSTSTSTGSRRGSPTVETE